MISNILNNYLRDYQKESIKTVFENRFSIINKSRQIGLSEVAVLIAVISAVGGGYRDIYLTSTSHRDAKELLKRAVKWVNILKIKVPMLQDAKIQKETIELPNSSRIIAIPAMGIRGRSAYLIILDEFAFQPNSKELWAALAPAVESNPNMKILAISTPLGTSGMFYDIWKNNHGTYDHWKRLEIDVYKAAKDGFPVNPTEMKKRYPSDIFKQEFECQFIGDQDQFFSNELLLRSTYDTIIGDVTECFGGVDLASKSDASILSTIHKSGEYAYVGNPTIIKPAGQEMDYSEQYREIVRQTELYEHSLLASDGCGEGKQVSQDLQSLYGKEKVKIYDSGTWKKISDTVYEMKRMMEQGKLKIYNSRELLRAFSQIKRVENSNKTISFKAGRDSKGHADSFFATVMAYDVLLNGVGANDFLFIP